MTQEIKQMIEQEAETFANAPYYKGGQKLSASPILYLGRGYTAGCMKGVEDAIEFAEWIGKRKWKLYSNDKWSKPSAGSGGGDAPVYTTTELLTIFYQQKEKA